MKVKYFEYNNDQNGEKYIEVSEEKFIKDVIITEGRFYISFGNFVFECSEREYRDYAVERNRHKYLSQDRNKKTVNLVSIEDVSEKFLLDESWEDEIIESIAFDTEKEKLQKALSELNEHELFLIHEYFYNNRKQSEIADLIGESQQTISYQIRACLVKLHELMKNN